VRAISALTRSRALAAALVVTGGLAYPLAVLADGRPHFPSKHDCSVPATEDGDVVMVLGSFDSVVRADALLARVKRMGYVNAEVRGDACENVEVSVSGYRTLADARNAVAEAARAGLHATLEQGG
jgi:hypothetical protein